MVRSPFAEEFEIGWTAAGEKILASGRNVSDRACKVLLESKSRML